MSQTTVFHEAPPGILFLHATGFNGETYQPLLEKLPHHLRAEAWDLRGHGASPLAADPAALTSWAVYANDVIAALVARGASQVFLAGHSLGAVVALLVAAKRPDLVRGLLMIEPPMVPPRVHLYARLPFGLAALRRFIPISRNAARRRATFPDLATIRAAYTGRGAFKTWQPGFLDAYVRGGTRPAANGGLELCCAPAWEAATFVAFRHNPWRAFTKIRCPLHLLVGAHHSTVKNQLSRVSKYAPSARHEIIPGTTHFIPMEMPDLVAARIAELAARV